MGHDVKKTWVGNPPTTCDLCNKPIATVFIDGKTSAASVARGRWAIMCVPCHAAYGMGLGTGSGQQYEKETASGEGGYDKVRWHKVKG